MWLKHVFHFLGYLTLAGLCPLPVSSGGICIAQSVKVPHDNSPAVFDKIIRLLLDNQQARAVILFTSDEDIRWAGMVVMLVSPGLCFHFWSVFENPQVNPQFLPNPFLVVKSQFSRTCHFLALTVEWKKPSCLISPLFCRKEKDKSEFFMSAFDASFVCCHITTCLFSVCHNESCRHISAAKSERLEKKKFIFKTNKNEINTRLNQSRKGLS